MNQSLMALDAATTPSLTTPPTYTTMTTPWPTDYTDADDASGDYSGSGEGDYQLTGSPNSMKFFQTMKFEAMKSYGF